LIYGVVNHYFNHTGGLARNQALIMSRRVHSSLDNLPAPLRDALTRMVVDNAWPQDWDVKNYGLAPGKPRYEDLVSYCKQKGFEISKSAIGRWAEQLKVFTLMKSSGLMARDVMAGLTEENAPKTQKAAAEMATALLLKLMVSGDDFTSKQLKEVSQAIRDLAQVSIKADQYIREQVKAKAEKADKAITTLGKKKKIAPEILKQIREEVYGIIS